MRIRFLLAAVAFATGSVFAQTAPPRVLLATSMGEVVVELDPSKAPVTVRNFVEYVKAGHYDGTIFHRVIDGFMIQGGGFDEKMREKPTRAPIRIESDNGLHNTLGTIAMARTSDPDSATSQFFINVKDNAALDYPGRDGHGYTVFGKVVSGLDVVQAIKRVPTAERGPHQNVPTTPVVIRKATLIDKP